MSMVSAAVACVPCCCLHPCQSFQRIAGLTMTNDHLAFDLPCRRQALDFFFTYFHLNYEESLVPPGTTIQELAAVAPGPKNSQGKFLWNMQAYALDPAGDLPSLQRLCNSFGCADLSPGQIPVYIGGYQLQIQQPFTAVSCCCHLLLLLSLAQKQLHCNEHGLFRLDLSIDISASL